MKVHYRKFIYIIVALVLTPVFFVFAASDQVEIKLTVDSAPDTTAPSVPSGLSATPISTSQIDLSWTASTDNVSVNGYQVFRDNAQIATSTVTSYSDTGLSAATTYNYNVTAFDPSNNISARSATSSATTSSAPTTPTSPGVGGGTFFPEAKAPFIFNVIVSPGMTSAVVSWETDEPAISSLSWGLNRDYGLGSLSETSFTKKHETIITGLVPGMVYYFEIKARDNIGNEGKLGGFSFLTLLPPDNQPPSNVRNLEAVLEEKITDNSILLTWENPIDPDFEAVRVLRGRSFYPRDPFDGEVVYDGPFEKTIDITGKDDLFFYTVFTRDGVGNYSSGAIVRPASPSKPSAELIKEFPRSSLPHPEIQKLNLLDFDFIQGDRHTVFVGGTVEIDSTRGLIISIDYDKVPDVLKTITVTLQDPVDTSKRFSFLLRVNADKTAYEAHIAPFGRSGIYPIQITIFDFKNQGVKTIEGELVAELVLLIEERAREEVNYFNLFWLFVLFLVFYVWYLRLVHKRGY
jgi:hypothetical protein